MNEPFNEIQKDLQESNLYLSQKPFFILEKFLESLFCIQFSFFEFSENFSVGCCFIWCGLAYQNM